jgi:hypothetical protein
MSLFLQRVLLNLLPPVVLYPALYQLEVVVVHEIQRVHWLPLLPPRPEHIVILLRIQVVRKVLRWHQKLVNVVNLARLVMVCAALALRRIRVDKNLARIVPRMFMLCLCFLDLLVIRLFFRFHWRLNGLFGLWGFEDVLRHRHSSLMAVFRTVTAARLFLVVQVVVISVEF